MPRHDEEWVRFLQWALPRMQMRWPGFRKVRRRVTKRIRKRMEALHLADVAAYQDYLQDHPEEWSRLDELCRVTISRFYRDRMAFTLLEDELLPTLAGALSAAGETRLRIWSAGCASGEEPYSLLLSWEERLRARFPQIRPELLATEVDDRLLRRCLAACYAFGSLKNLPEGWLERHFNRRDDEYCLHETFKRHVRFLRHDLRDGPPDGPFHLILCRNLAFTYYDEPLQRRIASQLHRQLLPGGLLMLGVHESLPEGVEGFECLSAKLAVYRRRG